MLEPLIIPAGSHTPVPLSQAPTRDLRIVAEGRADRDPALGNHDHAFLHHYAAILLRERGL